MGRRGLLDSQPLKEGGPLGERPAGDDRRDRERGRNARELEAAKPHERKRSDASQQRDDKAGHAGACDQSVVERLRVGMQHCESAEGDRTRQHSSAERADAKPALKLAVA